MVKVPDERLDRLATLVAARKTTYLELKLQDFPSQRGKEGASACIAWSSGHGGPCRPCRTGFQRRIVPHPLDSVDPARDIAALDLELALADLGIVERRIDRLTVEARSLSAGNRGAQERELALLKRIKDALESEKPVRAMGLTAEESATLSGYNLLTAKPLLLVLNIDEADVARTSEIEAEGKKDLVSAGISVIALAAKAEADVAELSPEEAIEFRKELGLPEEPATGRLLQEAVTLLGLITFFTAGPQDTRAWSIPAGTPAVKAAGRIHSDIERGFIRAEVIDWQELLATGSHAEAKKKGVMRVEGKTYEIRDGDVINVLFNV